MSGAHTPGPWQERSEYEPWLIIGNVDGEVLQDGPTYTYTEICELMVDADNPRETSANARLIAAAPELLAALVKVTPSRYMGEPPTQVSFYAAARAAIAKATGA